MAAAVEKYLSATYSYLELKQRKLPSAGMAVLGIVCADDSLSFLHVRNPKQNLFVSISTDI